MQYNSNQANTSYPIIPRTEQDYMNIEQEYLISDQRNIMSMAKQYTNSVSCIKYT